MKPTLIWDLPIRVFHWLLAAGLGVAAVLAFLCDEHGPAFPYHAMIGLTLALLVVLRLVWGFVGSRHARFGSLTLAPGAVIAHLKGARDRVGHNAATAYAMLAMFVLLGAMAVTGVMLGSGNEGAKEVHEVCAYALLGVAAVHVLGVLVHTVRFKENLIAGMVHGRKLAGPGEGIASAQPLAAAVLLGLTGAWAGGLLNNYDAVQRSTAIPLIGTTLQLGENEHGGGGDGAGRAGERRGHLDKDEDD